MTDSSDVLARELKQAQQQIIDSISDAIIVLHGDTIISTNSSVEHIFEYQANALVGSIISRIIPRAIGTNREFYHFLDTLEDHPCKENFVQELTGEKRSGERFPLRMTFSELPENSTKLRRFLVTCHDLSMEKLQEEQLRRTQKMDALGKLTGGIAHDYNNMLGVIIGYAKLVKDALRDDNKLSGYMAEIEKASERGTKLSRKLLAFSRNLQPDTDILDINRMLLENKALLEKTLTPRISLDYSLSANPWMVCVNTGELEDALLNLCMNAIQSIEFSGSVRISTSNCALSANQNSEVTLPEGEYVTLTVADTGVGINPEYISNIFDPFFTTKGQNGIGLGLSMVYRFVQRSHGQITVDSTPGKGSRFTLYFPRFRGKETAVTVKKPDAIATEITSGKEKVLIVDDEAAMLSLCEEVLTAKGYQVQSAASAEQALNYHDIKDIDLLISDVIMPGMDGYQLMDKVKEIKPDIKVLLMSGFTDNRHNISGNPSHKILQKPFSTATLLKQVRAALDSSVIEESAHKPCVLIMDDDESIRTLFRINLDRLGFQVLESSDGEEAIEMYSQSLRENHCKVDVVILDLAIPGGMGGIETAEALLKIDPDVNLIVSSGDSHGEIMNNYANYGFKAVLEKNFDREHMKAVIDAMLHEKQEITELA